ncbi:hypothetical protein LguiA_013888 [Lonicera macranthoides]
MDSTSSTPTPATSTSDPTTAISTSAPPLSTSTKPPPSSSSDLSDSVPVEISPETNKAETSVSPTVEFPVPTVVPVPVPAPVPVPVVDICPKPYECLNCLSVTKRRFDLEGLTSHSKACHGKLTELCTLCGNVFENPAGLTQHNRSKCTGSLAATTGGGGPVDRLTIFSGIPPLEEPYNRSFNDPSSLLSLLSLLLATCLVQILFYEDVTVRLNARKECTDFYSKSRGYARWVKGSSSGL